MISKLLQPSEAQEVKEVERQVTSLSATTISTLQFAEWKPIWINGYLKYNKLVSRITITIFANHQHFSFSASSDVGPGSYLLDKAEIKGLERFKPSKLPKKESNWDSIQRFAQPQNQTSQELGPGVYRQIDKWNKRTYNLKFLNNKPTG